MIDSVETWRVYSAEEAIPLGGHLHDAGGVRALIRSVTSSSWWKANVPYRVSVSVRVKGQDHLDGWVSSYAQPRDEGLGRKTRWLVSIHPGMMNNIVVLHELAHCVAPRWHYGGPTRRDYLHSHVRLPDHGPGFTGVLAELVAHFASEADHSNLRAAYDNFGVEALSLEDYREAAEQSLLAEEEVLSERLWAKGMAAQVECEQIARGDSSGAHRTVVPEFTWGDRFAFFRYRQPHGQRSLGRIATVLSQIERCTTRDVKRIETSKALPDDPRLRRLAMCMVSAYGLDPIYARYKMGLVRWKCGVELDELRVLNPEWVELVEEMNRQLEVMPSLWHGDGDR